MESDEKIKFRNTLQNVVQHKAVRKALKEQVKHVVSLKEIPLEKRWYLFITSELGDHSSTYHEPSGIDWEKNTLYDNFYTERYAFIDVNDMLSMAIDAEIIKEGSQEEIDFKEYFLKEFVKSFTNDW